MTNELTTYSNGIDPFDALANSLSSGLDGTFLKFSKGDWLIGKDRDEREINGKELIADLGNLQLGWRKWDNKRIAEQHIGPVAESYIPPQRNALGDLDDTLWERDDKGNPIDPWVFGLYMRLIDPGTGEAFIWSATSGGAKKAVGKLTKEFSKQRKSNPQQCTPVVKLETDAYQHPKYGRVKVPLLTVVDWRANDVTPALPAPDGSDDANDMDDDIPF